MTEADELMSYSLLRPTRLYTMLWRGVLHLVVVPEPGMWDGMDSTLLFTIPVFMRADHVRCN